MRILWSPQSLRDLDAIREYIAKDSEHYAGLTIARIFSAVEQLIRFPRSGNSGDRRNVPPFLF
jgi:plasmid stabilization system protein ParE